MKRNLAILIVAAVAFCAGYLVGGKKQQVGSFHDILVNHPQHLRALVTPEDKRVRTLAAELKTHENAFAFVRDRIGDDPAAPALPAGEILSEGRAGCLGKAVLLCSLYRAMGTPASQVRIATGEVQYASGIADHAWVDMEYKGDCLQQDASDFLGHFGFAQFHGMEFSRSFIRKEGYVFNDKHFAVVSQLNLLKGMGHPALE